MKTNASLINKNLLPTMKIKISAFLTIILLSALLLSAISTLTLPAACAKETWPSEVAVESRSAVLMDADTGLILYEKEPDTPLYPASITKVMTALLAVENTKLNEKVTFSHDAVFLNEGDTSHISRDEGEVMTMKECLYGMMLESANECAYAIGEHVGGGDIRKFVDMMNERAEQIGCTNTHFNNPNGLPDEEHYTTARDMALIAREAFSHKAFRKITSTTSYTIPPTNKHSDPTPLNNHHAMLHAYKSTNYTYEGCLGGKTGYTKVANATLVTYAKRGEMTLVCVTMNVSPPKQYEDTVRLMDFGFNRFVKYNVQDEELLSSVDTDVKTGALMEDDSIFEVGEGTVILPRSAKLSDVKYKVEPLNDGNESGVMGYSGEAGSVGLLEYTYGKRVVGSAELIVKKSRNYGYPFHNVPESEGGSSVDYIRISLGRVFGFLLFLVIVIIFTIWLRKTSLKMYSRQRRRRERRMEEKANEGKAVIDREKNKPGKRLINVEK